METMMRVKGMACGGCSANLERALKAIKGVEDVKADHKEGIVVVTHDTLVDAQALTRAVRDAGYETV